MLKVLTAPEYCGCEPARDTGVEFETELKLREHLKAALGTLSSRDQLVFYFTGHGTFVEEEYALALDPDARERITFGELLTELKKANVRRAIFVLDTCWSGNAADKHEGERSSLGSLSREKLPEGIAVLCSSGPHQPSVELSDGSLSLFTDLVTKAVTTGLDGRPTHQAMIGVDDVLDYVKSHLDSGRDFASIPQRPLLKLLGASGPVWFSRNISGAISDTASRSVTSEADLKVLYDRAHHDELPVSGHCYDDIDWALIDEYCKKRRPDLVAAPDRTKLLEALKLYSAIPVMGERALTRSAILCFAKRPTDFIPAARAVFEDAALGGEQFERIDVFGPVSSQITELTRLVQSRLRIVSEIDEAGQRREIAEVDPRLVRELVSNAVLHRSYELAGQVHVRLTHHQIEIRSPGVLRITWEEFVHDDIGSLPVNLSIAFLQSGLPVFEGLGLGARTVKEYLRQHGDDAVVCRALPGPTTQVSIRRRAPLPAIQLEPLIQPDELEHYKQAVSATHGSLLLAGFAIELRVALDLQELYVPLRAMVDLRGVGDANFADASDAEQRLAGQAEEIAIVHAFAAAKRRKKRALVILGDPGSGKSTHLKQLLLHCLNNGAAELGLSLDMIPVFLPLRELHGGRDLQAFVEQQIHFAQRELAADFGKRLLKRGRLLLLFDGLDELADEHERCEVSRWIEDAARVRPDCEFVVSCRFAGYGGKARLGATFLELHLRPFSRDQSEAFIRNWYRIVDNALMPGESTAREAQAGERASAFIERLRAPDVRSALFSSMTRNPLLLANLCLVHRDRGSLPTGRARLYAECIDVLLEHWRTAKGLGVEMTAEAGRRVLQPAALWLHEREGRTRASTEELATALDPSLAAVDYRGGGARDFLLTVREHSGLLTGWPQNQYGFMHLGFQEYLAASEIRRLVLEGDRQVLRMLADNYGKSWWQEVILVLLALNGPSLFIPFMREVVTREAFARESELIWLILEEAAEVSAEPFVELLQQPEQDHAAWARQQTALQVLAQRFPSQLDALAQGLANISSPSVRGWLERRAIQVASDRSEARVILSEQGGVELVLIRGGTFMLGSADSEDGRENNEGPQRQVTLSSFYLGRYPVTNEEYARFLQANPDAQEPLHWTARNFNQARQPVVGVSWEAARRFAEWAGGRLPTEAEWEYACRAGTQTSRYDELSLIAWDGASNSEHPRPVGEKLANAFGLYDSLGNVWEWCSDWYAAYSDETRHGPRGPEAGRGRVVRGGSWRDPARFVRAAARDPLEPTQRREFVGFRLARSIDSQS